MSFVPRREKNRKAFTTAKGLEFLGKAVGAAKASNAEYRADEWNNVGAKQRNNYREPMPSVSVGTAKVESNVIDRHKPSEDF